LSTESSATATIGKNSGFGEDEPVYSPDSRSKYLIDVLLNIVLFFLYSIVF
jgi:hypothetical protein